MVQVTITDTGSWWDVVYSAINFAEASHLIGPARANQLRLAVGAAHTSKELVPIVKNIVFGKTAKKELSKKLGIEKTKTLKSILRGNHDYKKPDEPYQPIEGPEYNPITPDTNLRGSKRKLNISPNNEAIYKKKKSTRELSFPNSPASTQVPEPESSNMRDASENASDPADKETKVDQLNYAVYRPFPSTHQVLMPLHFSTNWQTGTGTTAANASRIKFRLNSVFDVTKEDFVTDWTNITPDSDKTVAGQAYRQPQMRRFWEQIYNYYSVVACRYKYTFAMTTQSRSKAQVMIYKYLHGQQDPPLVDGGGSNLIPHRYKQHHPNCEFKALNSNGGFATVLTNTIEVTHKPALPDPATESYSMVGGDTYSEPWQPNTIDNTVTFYGKWHPGSINHAVLEDELTETWTQMQKTPKDHENLTFHVQISPYSQGNILMAGTLQVDMEYIVQLKDLQPQYEFITNSVSAAGINGVFEDETGTLA